MKTLSRVFTVFTLIFAMGFAGTTPVLSRASAVPGQSGLKAQILAGIEATYANKSFSADFNQAARLSALDITETATGRAWFSHPGRMRWLYLVPDHHEIITNGESLWIYRPGENQVMQGSAAPFFQAGAGGAFLSDITRIRTDFTITLDRADDTFAELILIPEKESPDLSSIRITVDRPSHEIQMVVTENVYGDTTRFIFTNIRFHTPDPSMFTFIVPDGTSVIDMN
ncbi:MAG: outer membrane lipoprotein carrier protein LolA [Desulfobacter sp.]